MQDLQLIISWTNYLDLITQFLDDLKGIDISLSVSECTLYYTSAALSLVSTQSACLGNNIFPDMYSHLFTFQINDKNAINIKDFIRSRTMTTSKTAHFYKYLKQDKNMAP